MVGSLDQSGSSAQMESQSGELIMMIRRGHRGFLFPTRYRTDALFFCIFSPSLCAIATHVH